MENVGAFVLGSRGRPMAGEGWLITPAASRFRVAAIAFVALAMLPD